LEHGRMSAELFFVDEVRLDGVAIKPFT